MRRWWFRIRMEDKKDKQLTQSSTSCFDSILSFFYHSFPFNTESITRHSHLAHSPHHLRFPISFFYLRHAPVVIHSDSLRHVYSRTILIQRPRRLCEPLLLFQPLLGYFPLSLHLTSDTCQQSSGRGGMGNIRQASVSRETRPDGPDDFSKSRGREPVPAAVTRVRFS